MQINLNNFFVAQMVPEIYAKNTSLKTARWFFFVTHCSFSKQNRRKSCLILWQKYCHFTLKITKMPNSSKVEPIILMISLDRKWIKRSLKWWANRFCKVFLDKFSAKQDVKSLVSTVLWTVEIRSQLFE